MQENDKVRSLEQPSKLQECLHPKKHESRHRENEKANKKARKHARQFKGVFNYKGRKGRERITKMHGLKKAS